MGVSGQKAVLKQEDEQKSESKIEIKVAPTPLTPQEEAAFQDAVFALLDRKLEPLPLEEVTEVDRVFLSFVRRYGWGIVEIVIKDKRVVMGRAVRMDWKFD